MSGRRSEATARALRLIARGTNPFAAARKAGVNPSTIYRARKAEREKEKKT